MGEDGQKYYVPRYLDEPLRIILWTWDELVAFALPILLIYSFSNQLLAGLIVGIGCFFGIKKLKGDEGHSFLKRFMYWHLPDFMPLKKTPPSYIREYIG